MSAVKARIVNTDHNNITLSVMEDLPSLSWSYKRSDVGSASWVVPLSHPNVERLDSLAPTGFGPKLTDFRIGVKGVSDVSWQTVHAGFCGPVGLDSTKDSISVAGVDWTAWLEQPYRFGGYTNEDKSTWTAEEVVKFWVNPDQSQQDCITDLIANTWDGDPYNMVHIVPEFEGTGWEEALFLTQVIIGDTSTILSKIKALGAMNEPYGFEFFMNWDKTLTMIAPRKTSIASAATASLFSFAPSYDNLLGIKWENQGPDAISLVGMPRDFPAFMGYSTHPASAIVYRDWLNYKNFGADIYNDQDATDRITAAYAKQLRFPQHSITITVQPELLIPDDPTYWFLNHCGDIIHVDSEDWFLPYHKINAYFWITSQEYKHDDAGNWVLTMTLEQVQN